jgi:hypothetical protein
MSNFSYKGHNKLKNYFEGWYLKVVDEKDNSVYAFIFGISLYKYDPHAFIQIIDNVDNDSYYFRFDIKDFFYNTETIKIKDNILSSKEVKIKVGSFDIDLSIEPTVELQPYGLTNSAMGCIKYLPLPTYHEIIFMNSKIEGTINNKEFHGNGYMEKNFGCKFPSQWLWVQSNHFKNYNASLTLAVADIFGKTAGFFCILNVDGDELRFATYNCFKINLEQNEDSIKAVMEKNDACLIVEVIEEKGHIIIGPLTGGKMKKEIEESLTSTLRLYLYKNGELIFHDTANFVGYENTYICTEDKEKTS